MTLLCYSNKESVTLADKTGRLLLDGCRLDYCVVGHAYDLYGPSFRTDGRRLDVNGLGKYSGFLRSALDYWYHQRVTVS